MEQILLENKVNNTLKWLANKIACIQTYHWNEEYKKECLNDAWQKVQKQFKKDIDWNALTESQCKALHFGRWQSEEDVKEGYIKDTLNNKSIMIKEVPDPTLMCEGCVYDGKFECIQHACCADPNNPVKYIEVTE